MYKFNYEPLRDAFTSGTFWKTLTGTPAISTSFLRFVTAKAIMLLDMLRGDFKFLLTVPATPTNANLTGGTSATAVIATWNAVADGEFTITINAETINVIGLDFSAAADMDAVAAIIQDGINALVNAREQVTVVWSTNKFIITGLSVVSVTSAVPSGEGTNISGAGATAFMDAENTRGTATSGSSKYFGLTQLGSGAIIAFRIFGAKLRCYAISETGVETIVDLPWDTDWSAAAISYRISWGAQNITFYINGKQVAVIGDKSNPMVPMSVFIQNECRKLITFLFRASKRQF